MYLLTQDKKTLCNFGRIEISQNLSFKRDKQVVLVAHPMGVESTHTFVTLGAYPDEETAAAELLRITEALRAGVAVYEVN